MRRFKGFTLTELMIALAVIGIIVAIVTPAIVKTRPNKNKMMIKKTYYTVENIIASLINDERLYPDKTDFCYPYSDDCRWGFDDTSMVGFEGNYYDGDNKFLNLFKSKLNIKSESEENLFTTADGVSWRIYNGLEPAKKVGTFNADGNGLNENADVAGVIEIEVGVEGEESLPQTNSSSIACTAASTDCNYYVIEVLANGKMRIQPTYAKAIEYVEVNTSLKN